MVAINNNAAATSSTSNMNGDYLYCYKAELTSVPGRGKNNIITMPATTADGGVITYGSSNAFMSCRPYMILVNLTLVNERFPELAEANGIAGMTGWVERSFDDMMGGWLTAHNGVKTHIKRNKEGADGKYSELADHLMNIGDDERILNVLLKIDMEHSLFNLEGKQVKVKEETFDYTYRCSKQSSGKYEQFKALNIYFNDFSMGAIKLDPDSMPETFTQHMHLQEGYRVETVAIPKPVIMTGMLSFALAASPVSKKEEKPVRVATGSTLQATIENMEKTRMRRSSAIASGVMATEAIVGSALSQGINTFAAPPAAKTPVVTSVDGLEA